MGNPQVLFLHGFPESSRKWEPYLKALADINIGAMAFDLPGYGKSGFIPGEKYDVDEVADRIIAKWEDKTKQPMYLVGHDWGGIIGWYVAAKLANKISGFTAIAAPFPSIFRDLVANDDLQKKASRYIEIFRSPTGVEFCTKRNHEHMKIGLCAESSKIADDEVAELVSDWSKPGRLEAMLQYYRIFFADSSYWANRLGPISTAVQVIWGKNDHALTIRNLDGLGSIVPNLQIDVLDAGHWLDRSHFNHVLGKIISHFQNQRRTSAHGQ